MDEAAKNDAMEILARATYDEHIQRLTSLIKQMQALGISVYHAPRLSIDRKLPREIVADVIDELVRQRKVYERVGSVFEPFPPAPPPAAELSDEAMHDALQAQASPRLSSSTPTPKKGRTK